MTNRAPLPQPTSKAVDPDTTHTLPWDQWFSYVDATLVALATSGGASLALPWAVTTNIGDAFSATFVPSILPLVDGQIVRLRMSATNNTFTPTFSPNGDPARVIVKQGGSQLNLHDIEAPTSEILLAYNLANTRWELLNPQGVFTGSGANGNIGYVPFPGLTAGTRKFLREDATWNEPPVFVASGASHNKGYVPDPGAVAGVRNYLREDATWQKTDFYIYPPSGDTSGATDKTNLNSLQALGLRIQLLEGNYYLNGTVTISTDNTALHGHGMSTTVINVTVGNTDAIKVTGNAVRLSSFGMTCTAGSVTAGAAIYSQPSSVGPGAVFDHLNINLFFYGIRSNNENKAHYSHIILNKCKQVGMWLDGPSSNLNCHDLFVIQAGFGGGTGAGLYMFGACAGNNFSQCQFTTNVFNLFIDGPSASGAANPNFCKFVECYFDNGTSSDQINAGYHIEFVDCWISNGSGGDGGVKVTSANVSRIAWIGCQFWCCNQFGLYINAAANWLQIIGCQFISNSQGAASVWPGIYCDAAAKHGMIKDCTMVNDVNSSATFTQKYGFWFVTNAGADDWDIQGNNCGPNPGGANATDNNRSGSYLIQSGNTNIRVIDTKPDGVTNIQNRMAAGSCNGSRAQANNTTVTTFATVAVNGGANSVPLYCEGTNWFIG